MNRVWIYPQPDLAGVSFLGFLVYDDETLEDLQLNNLYIIQRRSPSGLAWTLCSLPVLQRQDPGHHCGSWTEPVLWPLMSAKTMADKIIGRDRRISPIWQGGLLKKWTVFRVQYRGFGYQRCSTPSSAGGIDVVVLSTLYKVGRGLVNPDESRAISRHEILCTLEDVVKTASSLLRYMVSSIWFTDPTGSVISWWR